MLTEVFYSDYLSRLDLSSKLDPIIMGLSFFYCSFSFIIKIKNIITFIKIEIVLSFAKIIVLYIFMYAGKHKV